MCSAGWCVYVDAVGGGVVSVFRVSGCRQPSICRLVPSSLRRPIISLPYSDPCIHVHVRLTVCLPSVLDRFRRRRTLVKQI
jgi:hypothetical protein